MTSKPFINVLGVTFDSKLNWQTHVDNTIKKCNKTLHAINLTRDYFSQDEKLHIINAFLYSKLYYCSTVWLTPTLNQNYVQKLKRTSAKALRIVVGDDFSFFSFDELHSMFNRATPVQWSFYQHSLQFYKSFNYHIPEQIWLELCDQISLSERTHYFRTFNNSKRRVGLNKFVNRLNFISQRINVNDLNLSLDTFKVKMKKEFIF